MSSIPLLGGSLGGANVIYWYSGLSDFGLIFTDCISAVPWTPREKGISFKVYADVFLENIGKVEIDVVTCSFRKHGSLFTLIYLYSIYSYLFAINIYIKLF
jgi:hypothetical protein